MTRSLIVLLILILGLIVLVLYTSPRFVMQNDASERGQKPEATASVKKKIENLPVCRCETMHDIPSQEFIIEELEESIMFLNQTTKEHLMQHHPNMPVKFALDMAENTRCNLMPSIFNITWQNIYWQEAKLGVDTTFLLYSAVYDNRTLTDARPCVRLLGVSSALNLPPAYCHFWFDVRRPPVPSEAVRIDYLDYQKKSKSREMTYLLTCRIPPDMASLKPEAVSLVQNPCQIATNLLHVEGAGERRSPFLPNSNASQNESWNEREYPVAVCGPALYYYRQDFSTRLVEWIEALRVQGISQIFLYETDVHPNIEKVLRYYEQEGFVHVTKYSYPPPYFNEPSIRRLWTLVERFKMWAQENVYFTDCLLRHMHQYRFIAHYDPDELPVLLHHQSYPAMFNQLLNTSYVNFIKKKTKLPIGYKLHWSIFYDDVEPPASTHELPEYLHMMRHIMRPKKNPPYTPGTFKAVYDMDYTTGVFSHDVLVCNTDPCPSQLKQVSSDMAYLAHFSRTCGKNCKTQDEMKEEPAILKHVNAVKVAVSKVCQKLNLL